MGESSIRSDTSSSGNSSGESPKTPIPLTHEQVITALGGEKGLARLAERVIRTYLRDRGADHQAAELRQYVAEEVQRELDEGVLQNQRELAVYLNTSAAEVCQVLERIGTMRVSKVVRLAASLIHDVEDRLLRNVRWEVMTALLAEARAVRIAAGETVSGSLRDDLPEVIASLARLYPGVDPDAEPLVVEDEAVRARFEAQQRVYEARLAAVAGGLREEGHEVSVEELRQMTGDWVALANAMRFVFPPVFVALAGLSSAHAAEAKSATGVPQEKPTPAPSTADQDRRSPDLDLFLQGAIHPRWRSSREILDRIGGRKGLLDRLPRIVGGWLRAHCRVMLGRRIGGVTDQHVSAPTSPSGEPVPGSAGGSARAACEPRDFPSGRELRAVLKLNDKVRELNAAVEVDTRSEVLQLLQRTRRGLGEPTHLEPTPLATLFVESLASEVRTVERVLTQAAAATGREGSTEPALGQVTVRDDGGGGALGDEWQQVMDPFLRKRLGAAVGTLAERCAGLRALGYDVTREELWRTAGDWAAAREAMGYAVRAILRCLWQQAVSGRDALQVANLEEEARIDELNEAIERASHRKDDSRMWDHILQRAAVLARLGRYTEALFDLSSVAGACWTDDIWYDAHRKQWQRAVLEQLNEIVAVHAEHRVDGTEPAGWHRPQQELNTGLVMQILDSLHRAASLGERVEVMDSHGILWPVLPGASSSSSHFLSPLPKLGFGTLTPYDFLNELRVTIGQLREQMDRPG